jgi:hypothetical protein
MSFGTCNNSFMKFFSSSIEITFLTLAICRAREARATSWHVTGHNESTMIDQHLIVWF